MRRRDDILADLLRARFDVEEAQRALDTLVIEGATRHVGWRPMAEVLDVNASTLFRRYQGRVPIERNTDRRRRPWGSSPITPPEQRASSLDVAAPEQAIASSQLGTER